MQPHKDRTILMYITLSGKGGLTGSDLIGYSRVSEVNPIKLVVSKIIITI